MIAAAREAVRGVAAAADGCRRSVLFCCRCRCCRLFLPCHDERRSCHCQQPPPAAKIHCGLLLLLILPRGPAPPPPPPPAPPVAVTAVLPPPPAAPFLCWRRPPPPPPPAAAILMPPIPPLAPSRPPANGPPPRLRPERSRCSALTLSAHLRASRALRSALLASSPRFGAAPSSARGNPRDPAGAEPHRAAPPGSSLPPPAPVPFPSFSNSSR